MVPNKSSRFVGPRRAEEQTQDQTPVVMTEPGSSLFRAKFESRSKGAERLVPRLVCVSADEPGSDPRQTPHQVVLGEEDPGGESLCGGGGAAEDEQRAEQVSPASHTFR